ncbi:hypothetical protein BMS3Abin07_01807 [bacterium BMS3Abin07]|nr:hypothetical protein BMS3Abin07_01807 [bacterium BMS3Abin07]GBE31981.1 hypothetical protein BMS3Bbin05_00888 [bacterium BMS3Bbin05]HDO21755.1 DUF2155 domain-containing protein [Nitrospirota bacterium]HDZ87625.1 DUF2155 domain-containing protein [Nitrospirota bacterium]
MKKVLVLLAVLSLLIAFGACKQKVEEKASVQTPNTPAGQGIVLPKGETKVVVPDSVKAKWNAVIITVQDKVKKKTEDVKIKLGSEYTIPNSRLTLKVSDFLPDFRMDGLTITSASDKLNNPAVHVTVLDGGREIFKGWLYSKFPTIHPFQHDKYGLTLKEAVTSGKKG